MYRGVLGSGSTRARSAEMRAVTAWVSASLSGPQTWLSSWLLPKTWPGVFEQESEQVELEPAQAEVAAIAT